MPEKFFFSMYLCIYVGCSMNSNTLCRNYFILGKKKKKDTWNSVKIFRKEIEKKKKRMYRGNLVHNLSHKSFYKRFYKIVSACMLNKPLHIFPFPFFFLIFNPIA